MGSSGHFQQHRNSLFFSDSIGTSPVNQNDEYNGNQAKFVKDILEKTTKILSGDVG